MMVLQKKLNCLYIFFWKKWIPGTLGGGHAFVFASSKCDHVGVWRHWQYSTQPSHADAGRISTTVTPVPAHIFFQTNKQTHLSFSIQRKDLSSIYIIYTRNLTTYVVLWCTRPGIERARCVNSTWVYRSIQLNILDWDGMATASIHGVTWFPWPSCHALSNPKGCSFWACLLRNSAPIWFTIMRTVSMGRCDGPLCSQTGMFPDWTVLAVFVVVCFRFVLFPQQHYYFSA